MLQDYPDTQGIQVQFLADHDAAWTHAADLHFDASKILGSVRCKRFAAVLEGELVKDVFVEADGTGVTTSAAEHVIKKL
jgi:2-Cys peroxiredoxin 5